MSEIALIFPGQGAQFVGMGKEFYEQSQEARAIFDRAEGVIKGLKEVVFNGPAEQLTSTSFCQPGIFTFSMAAYAALKGHDKFKGLRPAFACGLSLGECSAVCASGALDFDAALRMVERRAAFMDEACRLKKGAMAAVIGFDKDKLVEICRGVGVEVANFNSPEQIVITGEVSKVEAAAGLIKQAGAKRVIPLDVAGAFHSSLMQPAVPKFEAQLKRLAFQPPDFAVISNVDGAPALEPARIHQNLARQITSSVQWVKSVEHMAAHGVKKLIEIGPGTVLKGLVRKINAELTVFNIQKPDDIDQLAL